MKIPSFGCKNNSIRTKVEKKGTLPYLPKGDVEDRIWYIDRPHTEALKHGFGLRITGSDHQGGNPPGPDPTLNPNSIGDGGGGGGITQRKFRKTIQSI